MNKFKKAAVLGLCCGILSTGAVSAMTKDILINELRPNIEIGIDYELMPQHREIDNVLFNTHVKEIEKLGFTITHTGPHEDYIEIGILPYNEANADYLYGLFGREGIKVVEGVQAITLPINDPNGLPYENRIISDDNGIGVQVNGQRLPLDVEPFIENSRTLIPLRGVMEELGATVFWNHDLRAVEIKKDDIYIQLEIGKETAKVVRSHGGTSQEELLPLDVPAVIKEGRTFIPGRFVSETLAAKVEWNDSLKLMTINTDDLDIIEEIGDSIEEMGKAISVDSIKEMKMFSLMGEEIKTFTSDEVKEIIGHLNTGSTYNGAYITLLTGNSIKIYFENNDTLQLTSYGFEDHVILSGEINKEFMSYCIVSPEVGMILLSQNK